MLRIDLTKVESRRDSGDVRLNSPRGRGSSHGSSFEVETSSTSRGKAKPMQTKLPNTARDPEPRPKHVPLRPTRPMQAVPLKAVNVFPPGERILPPESTSGKKSTSTPAATNKHTKGSMLVQKSLVDEENPTEQVSQVLTISGTAADVPVITFSTFGSFPQRNVLRKNIDNHLPNHLLLQRQRLNTAGSNINNTNIDLTVLNQRTPSPQNPASSGPPLGEIDQSFDLTNALSGRMVSPNTRQHNIQTSSQGKDGHVLFYPTSPVSAVKRSGTRPSPAAEPLNLEPSVVLGVYTVGHGASGLPAQLAPLVAHGAGTVDMSSTADRPADGEAAVGGGGGPVTTAPGSRSSVRVTLPSAAPKRDGTPPSHTAAATDKSPSSSGKGRSAKNKPVTPRGLDRVTTSPRSAGKVVKPTEFIIDAESLEDQFERELNEQLSITKVSADVKSPQNDSQTEPARPVTCAVHDLVAPSMPTSPKPARKAPSSSHSGMHRTLVARIHRHTRQLPLSSPMNDSPDKPKSSPAVPGSGAFGLQSPLQRRQLNDTLSGTRTNAVTGVLLQQPGERDLRDLLQGSAAVAISVQHHQQLQEDQSPVPPPPLSPVAAEAIEAARLASQQERRLSGALSPQSILHQYNTRLSHFERQEIVHYPKVYYLGLHPAKGRVGMNRKHEEFDDTVPENYGYDDAEGNYITAIGDQLRYRYEVFNLLGKGSFGEVHRCRDHKLGVDVAVKVIKNKPAFNAQADKELQALQLVLSEENRIDLNAEQMPFIVNGQQHKERRQDGHHHYMIQLFDSFLFRNHKCFVFPVYGRNLYEYLRDKNFTGLPMSAVRRVAQQLFAALAHLSTLNLIHCDIKPENILLRNDVAGNNSGGNATTANNNSNNSSSLEIVLTDFGSSCVMGEQTFTYIQSRFYRSPEVLLGLPYGPSIDLWSAACILPELRTGEPTFPGETGPDQLACIVEVLGIPSAEMRERSPRRDRYFSAEGELLPKVSPRGHHRVPGTRTLDTIARARRKDAEFVDFLTRCLRWAPEDRLTPAQALQHPWLTDRPVGGNPHTESAVATEAVDTPEM